MIRYAIIVAGGKGLRMNAKRPKQFLEIDGKPILVHTIRKFLSLPDINIILVLPKAHVGEWDNIQSEYFSSSKFKIVVGGETRTESVQAGLDLIEGDGVVAIHDAVRPYVSEVLIEDCFKSAEEYGSGVAAVKLKDSLRKRKGEDDSAFRDRNDYVLVQTPQTFKISELKDAYDKIEGSFSDDATVFEMARKKVRLIEGDYANIKITTTEDLRQKNPSV